MSAPAITPGMMSGRVTSRNVCQGVAPRSRAASKIDSSMPASRARTMIATKPMQNVTCAMTTVVNPSPKSMPMAPSAGETVLRKKIRSDTPRRISGIATGVNTRNGSSFGLKRCMESPAMVPSTVAIAAAPPASSLPPDARKLPKSTAIASASMPSASLRTAHPPAGQPAGGGGHRKDGEREHQGQHAAERPVARAEERFLDHVAHDPVVLAAENFRDGEHAEHRDEDQRRARKHARQR